ncbi:hypothetical protein COV58_03990 [Candidatus Roizmanbacteria bacterium CG11_big_fil_rev_8_21_14_0_20_36_8]|uniref:Uncharacterized protein n=2 Tax=Candidatus Roizmaniibacteriota TaxID=1752723 RepID=A0A2M6ITA0_9BACT|nr:MAG: hypothetical protein COV58_03990 [Candidatus Roizmanbacteria bacterium CG11_big_fil_rev_8_21_14_0_20_36_8]PIZ64786.1 MAG: hypothetical protein COY14_03965 [Candidatus Roizmanbacteria bacterium CG_4_10_14_0_2_um_filter_36_9]
MNSKNHLLHKIDTNVIKTSKNWPIIVGVVVLTMVLGIGTGFGVNTLTSKSSSRKTTTTVNQKDSSGEMTSAGILDKNTFKDNAEGVLKEGGFEGEGTFHLERPGGDDQNVYLTSTTVDLSEFIDKKVSIWGATFDSEKAGWLMDVGFIEIVK